MTTDNPPAATADLGEVRTWRHDFKGLITGQLVRQDQTWTRIRLAGDHTLTYGSELHRGRVDEAGAVITVRSARISLVDGAAST